MNLVLNDGLYIFQMIFYSISYSIPSDSRLFWDNNKSILTVYLLHSLSKSLLPKTSFNSFFLIFYQFNY